MIICKLTPAVLNEALRLLPSHKAPGPDNIPGVLIKHMSQEFHEAVFQLFQIMTITGRTPPKWLHSNTILIYKKNDMLDLTNYIPIALAFALYKLWTSCLNILASDFVEAHKVLSPEQEGFRSQRSCSRAITHLGLCIEDAHTHDQDVLLAQLDFTSAFPYADHTQLTRILHFVRIPEDFIIIVANLYSDAHTQFLTPYGWTRLVQILRGTLQGDSLSPLIFDLMVEPLTRWIKSTPKDYTLTSNNLSLSSKR
jgi:hypothetical protein